MLLDQQQYIPRTTLPPSALLIHFPVHLHPAQLQHSTTSPKNILFKYVIQKANCVIYPNVI